MIDLELNLARNMRGPLDRKIRRRLAAYAENPTVRGWDDVAHLIVGADGQMTVWCAWIATDPSAAQRGATTDADGRIIADWVRWPDQRAFRRALEYATH